MRKVLICGLMLAGVACQKPAPEAGAAHDHDHEHSDTHAWTVWKGDYELYAEQSENRWALHLSRTSKFRPIADAECVLIIGEKQLPAKPGNPGIYTVDSPEGKAVRCTIDKQPVVFLLSGDGQTDKAGIRLTKEQQWVLDMTTGSAEQHNIQQELRVPAEIRVRQGGVAEVTAPLAGRLVFQSVPAIGTLVARDTPLAGVLPPANTVADLPSLELAEAEAKTALSYARRDRERAERLVEAGAAPARRLEEARTVETNAAARLRTAELRLKQLEASREAAGAEVGLKRFLVRAPIEGLLTEITVPSGSNVDAGATLFRLMDVTTVYAVAQVPESALAKLKSLGVASLEMGEGRTIRPGRLVSIGRMVDPATRTIPVIWEVANPDRQLAINQLLSMRIALPGSTGAVALPEAAVVEEGATQAVYLQKSGELFERRVVTTGLRGGGLVEIRQGLADGERVVVRGAYLVRLASLGGGIPEEGHVH